MNDVIKALKERRSIRQYTTEAVSEQDLQTILDAAGYAPTARNTQAWHITVLVGADKIAALNAEVKKASGKPGFDKYKDFVGAGSYTINYQNAPVFIIVGTDREQSASPAEDGALVLANIFLAAHSLGLGTCWINQLGPIGDEPGFRNSLTELGFPPSHKVIGCAALGHSAKANPPAPPRKTGQVNIIK
jgi:nitroreductase